MQPVQLLLAIAADLRENLARVLTHERTWLESTLDGRESQRACDRAHGSENGMFIGSNTAAVFGLWIVKGLARRVDRTARHPICLEQGQ